MWIGVLVLVFDPFDWVLEASIVNLEIEERGRGGVKVEGCCRRCFEGS
jgi:hypothetical protein